MLLRLVNIALLVGWAVYSIAAVISGDTLWLLVTTLAAGLVLVSNVVKLRLG